MSLYFFYNFVAITIINLIFNVYEEIITYYYDYHAEFQFISTDISYTGG